MADISTKERRARTDEILRITCHELDIMAGEIARQEDEALENWRQRVSAHDRALSVDLAQVVNVIAALRELLRPKAV
jgi:hypothetical protein